MRPRWRSVGRRRTPAHLVRGEDSQGGVSCLARNGRAASRGRNSDAAVALQAIEASAVLWSDQPIEEAASERSTAGSGRYGPVSACVEEPASMFIGRTVRALSQVREIRPSRYAPHHRDAMTLGIRRTDRTAIPLQSPDGPRPGVGRLQSRARCPPSPSVNEGCDGCPSGLPRCGLAMMPTDASPGCFGRGIAPIAGAIRVGRRAGPAWRELTLPPVRGVGASLRRGVLRDAEAPR